MKKTCANAGTGNEIASIFDAKLGAEREKAEQLGQVNKSIRGMPWHWEPKKDVISCEKLR